MTAQGPVQRVGQYDLVAMLGRGGMGVVWKGLHRHLGQAVAIKFLSPSSWSDPQAIARFYREMRAIGRVAHPHLVRALDAGEFDGHHVLVMEYVEGWTVRDLLDRTGPLPVGAACEIVRQAALGVSAIAAAAMVHRDLKPSNLMLTSDGTVKILDLGLARLRAGADEVELTTSGDILGTIDYMAPEQSDDPRSVDTRADLYSLGCTLYAILAGHAPFSASRFSSIESRLRAHREEPPPQLAPLRPDVPAALADVVSRLLAKSPVDRIASAEELAASLAPFASLPALVTVAARLNARAEVPSKDRSSQPVTSSRVETSENSISPDATTPREWNRAPSATAPDRRRSRIAMAITFPAAVLLIAFGVSQWHNRDAAPVPEPIARQPESVPSAEDHTGAGTGETGAKPASKPEAGALVVRGFQDAAKLQWHELLDRRPIPVFWEGGEGLARWEWEEKRSQLAFANNETGLLSLGRIDAGDFMVQVGIHQNGWPGGIGLFFGLEKWDPHRSVPGWDCYELTIHQVEADGPRQNRIDFSHVETAPGAGRPIVFHPTALASETVRGPVGEAMLELTVKRGRLVQILFDGAELQDLLETIGEVRPKIRWTGVLGVCVDGGDATVRKARIKLLEE